MELCAIEQRTPVLPELGLLVKKRATAPAVYVVDSSLNVLYYRNDPDERRTNCLLESAERGLPPAIAATAQELLDLWKSQNTETRVMSATAGGSLVVRLMLLDGGPAPVFAVLVERLKLRAGLRAVAQRYALSKREHEALALLVQGAKNNEIAERLQIAPSTAIFHVKRLMVKTGARNRAELVAKVVG